MPRPTDQANYKSWVVNWKGNTPVLQQTAWAPDYTPGHKETPQEAIAAEAIALVDSIASFREKWLKLNLLAEQQNHQLSADAFGTLLKITETDDPNEEMTMPAGAQSVESDPTDQDIEDMVDGEFEAFDNVHERPMTHQAQVNIPIVDPNDIDVVEGADIVEHMYTDGDVPSGLQDYEVRGQNGAFLGYQGSARD